jgi:hypothetical protein
MMRDVPSMAVFCREFIERCPGIIITIIIVVVVAAAVVAVQSGR